MTQNIIMKITEKSTNFPSLVAILGEMVYKSSAVVAGAVHCFYHPVCQAAEQMKVLVFIVCTHFSRFALYFLRHFILDTYLKGYTNEL